MSDAAQQNCCRIVIALCICMARRHDSGVTFLLLNQYFPKIAFGIWEKRSFLLLNECITKRSTIRFSPSRNWISLHSKWKKQEKRHVDMYNLLLFWQELYDGRKLHASQKLYWPDWQPFLMATGNDYRVFEKIISYGQRIHSTSCVLVNSVKGEHYKKLRRISWKHCSKVLDK